ncbi:MAG TPA: tautomerase family protein [Noviherbaspirillum sp.]|nr:tautomerase family protein [Noviherbaspirillum sp.]
MAIVRIDFTKRQPTGFAQAVASAVNMAMQNVLSVPAKENFVICQAHDEGMLLHDPENLTADRLTGIVFVQITLNQGRSPELKSAFFTALTHDICTATSVRPEDVYINLIEVARENWSFGSHC